MKKGLAIVWSPASKFFDHILEDMTEFVNVIDCVKLKCGNHFKEFVYEIYHDMGEYKPELLEYKFQHIFVDENEWIMIVNFYYDDAQSEYHSYKKRRVCKVLNELKIFIREKYKLLMKNYYFDNIFHCTDDETEFEIALNVIMAYYPLKCDMKGIWE